MNSEFSTQSAQNLPKVAIKTNLGTLNRYKFVPVTSNTAMSDTMLQGLIRTQSAFSRSVFVYTCQNVSNIEHFFQITEDQPTDSMENSTSTTTASSQHPVSYQYSLRDGFYDIEADDGTNLIHAVYSTNDSSIIRVLCETRKRYVVLDILHNLYVQVQQHFPPEALTTYFPTYDTHPFLVDKFPRVAAECGTYAQELTRFTTNNPQEDSQDVIQGQDMSNTGTKRQRDGAPKTSTYAAAASAAGASPPSDWFQRLEANKRNIESINQTNEQHTRNMTALEDAMKNITTSVETHEKALATLADTQAAQGDLLTSLNKKQQSLERHMIRLCDHLQVPVETEPTDPPLQATPTDNTVRPNEDHDMQDTTREENDGSLITQNSSNPSYGEPEGTPP